MLCVIFLHGSFLPLTAIALTRPLCNHRHMDADDRITLKEAAELHGVSRMTFIRWTDAGKVPYTQTLSGQRRYSRADVVALLPSRTDVAS